LGARLRIEGQDAISSGKIQNASNHDRSSFGIRRWPGRTAAFGGRGRFDEGSAPRLPAPAGAGPNLTDQATFSRETFLVLISASEENRVPARSRVYIGQSAGLSFAGRALVVGAGDCANTPVAIRLAAARAKR
jgi:hypothetical protein